MQATIKRTESGKYAATVTIRTESGPKEVASKEFKTLSAAQGFIDSDWMQIADSENATRKPRLFVRNRMSSIAKSSGAVTGAQIGGILG